ncbi:MAG: Gfo/Idh/MocA family oxidoreductase [Planctomycetes bacterium]|nr:Gfo/Idh/MocA family oxidoreductase [Planctomycetota bacterium]
MTNRRDFLKAAGAATAGVASAAMTMNASSYAQVGGANERIGVAFLGVGGRCQQHIDVVLAMQQANRNSVAPVAVCDVWNGDPQLGSGRGRGLYPSAQRCGLQRDDARHVTKDYRRILELREVDAVAIATPDHWHAKMSIDAAAAGKHIYCEKPMTKTIEEAHAVVDAARRANVVMTVGVQSMADPTWRSANAMIRRGDIGHVCQAQTSYYRNSLVGQWRYYPLRRDMNPTTIDWDMFLGHRFHVFEGTPLATQRPFDRAIFAQWRCYWDFGGGMFTDLFVHQTTHMIAAMGVRYPARVVGAGGVYLEYDGRDVPDVATVVADYDEGCQLIITATMINDHGIEECIRGRLATLKFGSRTRREGEREIREFGYEILPQSIDSRPRPPGERNAQAGRFVPGGLEGDDTAALWRNFLECVRARNRDTFSTPELGAAAFTTVNMGVQSYRSGRVLFWDRERRRPTQADDSWARNLERKSHERGRPNQIIGWEGGTSGSTLTPPDYQRLEGEWTNGRDPAPAASGTGTSQR